MSSIQIYLLSLFQTVSSVFERVFGIVKQGIHSVIDANSPRTWLFSQRNTLPWALRDDLRISNYYMYPMTYNPSSKTFSLYSRNREVSYKFGDVVIASLTNSDGILWYDMSSFFHTLSWEAGPDCGPSLYEVVIVFCLAKNLVFTAESMKTFYLDVYTIEGKNYRIKISDLDAMRDFTSWNVFEKYVVPEVAVSTSTTAVSQVSIETPAPVA